MEIKGYTRYSIYTLKEKKAGMVMLVSKRHTQKTRLKESLHCDERFNLSGRYKTSKLKHLIAWPQHIRSKN